MRCVVKYCRDMEKEIFSIYESGAINLYEIHIVERVYMKLWYLFIT